jgi:predicted kinase
VLVKVEAPIGVIRDRLRRREAERDPLDHSTATLEVFEKMVADVQPIQHEHLTVDTSKDMTPVLDKIASLLQS